MTRKELAARIGAAGGSLSQWEGREPPTLPKKLDLDAIAAALDLTPAESRELRLAAELTYSPAGIQALVRRLLDERAQRQRR